MYSIANVLVYRNYYTPGANSR